MRQIDSECSAKCSGDSSASCGGAQNLVSSYITDSSSTYVKIIDFTHFKFMLKEFIRHMVGTYLVLLYFVLGDYDHAATLSIK